MIKRICDICGEDIPARYYKIRIQSSVGLGAQIYYKESEKEYDICADCYQKIIEILNAIK